MNDDVSACLYDIVQAGRAIHDFVEGESLESYVGNAMVRSAVERKFEIMGEALNRIKKLDQDVLTRIRNARSIISFRNILIHGYDSIDDRIVWAVVQNDLHELMVDVEGLIASE
jgi:uncharacterized protein with HEPN domain